MFLSPESVIILSKLVLLLVYRPVYVRNDFERAEKTLIFAKESESCFEKIRVIDRSCFMNMFMFIFYI